MKHEPTWSARTITTAVASALLLAPGWHTLHAPTHPENTFTPLQQSGLAEGGRARPGIGYDSTLFATWGTVTNGNSSANAAEYRKAFTGGHAGSANAAEAPAFSTTSR